MADKKISALTAATTPLAGSEVLPIVQGGSTVKVSVDNLTAGKTVSAQALDVSMLYFDPTVPPRLRAVPAGADPTLEWDRWGGVGTNYTGARFAYDGAIFSFANAPVGTIGSLTFTNRLEINATGDVKASTGNFVVGTAGKGIDFSATTSAAGMTSELLADYEEGTWTPSVGGDATYTYRAATYTRIGRQIILQCDMIINAIGTGSTTLVSGIPFAAADSNFYSGAVSFWSNLNGTYAFVTPAMQSGNIQFNTTALASSNMTDSSAIFTSGSRIIFSLAYIA